MAANLLDDVSSMLGPDLFGRLGKGLGESPETIERATKAGLPALLGGISELGSTPNGASKIIDVIRSQHLDANTVSGFGSMLGDDTKRSQLLEGGKGILGSLFGGSKVDGMIDTLSQSTGVRRASMGGLVAMLTPMVMGVIGKKVSDEGLGATGLSSFFGNQLGFLKNLIPGGMGKLFGMGAAGVAAAGAAARSVGQTVGVTGGHGYGEPHAYSHGPAGPVHVERRPESALPSWLWPLLALAGLSLLGLWLWRANRTTEVPRAIPVQPATRAVPAQPTPAPVRYAERGIGGLGAFERYVATNDGVLPQRFIVENLNFVSGTAGLDPSAQAVVTRLATVMRAHPSATVRIEGNTDSTGDAATNRSLSLARATSVRDSLGAMGIDANRVFVAGYGPDRPIAPNDTEQGRAENRRTDLVLLSR